tara:strand:+ start:492 stop:1259 length:768 start_codon:yes stop_codon:yes gene_type:complete
MDIGGKMKNKIKNSFLIATNRNYNTHAKIVVDQLESCGALDDGEILVCCPFEIDDKRIKYIKDNKQQNGNVAFNICARSSQGEYLYILCDDHFVSRNILLGDQFLNSPTFQYRKYKIASMSSGAPCYIGPIPNFPQTDFIPTNVMCRFPFFNRKTYIDHLNGYVFHPNFNICSHFADNYLSYFLAVNGEPTIECGYIQLQQMVNTDQVEDGSVEPFGGPENRYPAGYLESLDVYVNLCKELKKDLPHVNPGFRIE